ncbi:hypothetical protein RQP46_008987 [Phenoliferia psychrophenolica]
MSGQIILRPATRPLHFIPEIASLIVAEFAATWAAAALSLLYSDLHLNWRYEHVQRFLAAIEDHPELLLRITRLDASQPRLSHLTKYAYEHDGIFYDSEAEAFYLPRWQAYVEAFDPAWGEPEPFDLQWCLDERMDDARRTALSDPDGTWVDDSDTDVTESDVAFWTTFVPRLARLKHLRFRVQGFSDVGEADRVVDLVKAAGPILKNLKSLEVMQDSVEPGPAYLAGTLVRVATGLKSLTTHGWALSYTPLIPALRFPQLRRITITRWSPLDDEDSEASECYTILDLVLACRKTLESLEFTGGENIEEDLLGTDLINIAGVLPQLSVLRDLRLRPSQSAAFMTLENHDDITYPSQFFDAISRTHLHTFAITEPPTKALLDALPPTIQSVTFNPELATIIPDNTPRPSRSHNMDRAFELLVAAKDHHLPLLRYATLKREPDTFFLWAARPIHSRMNGMEEIDAEIERESEEEQLARERRAGEAGFGLMSRQCFEVGPADFMYELQA